LDWNKKKTSTQGDDEGSHLVLFYRFCWIEGRGLDPPGHFRPSLLNKKGCVQPDPWARISTEQL
jgi:hypothetical protein